MGPEARKVMQPIVFGAAYVDVEDCVNGRNCRAEEFMKNAELIAGNLPLACEADYRGVK